MKRTVKLLSLFLALLLCAALLGCGEPEETQTPLYTAANLAADVLAAMQVDDASCTRRLLANVRIYGLGSDTEGVKHDVDLNSTFEHWYSADYYRALPYHFVVVDGKHFVVDKVQGDTPAEYLYTPEAQEVAQPKLNDYPGTALLRGIADGEVEAYYIVDPKGRQSLELELSGAQLQALMDEFFVGVMDSDALRGADWKSIDAVVRLDMGKTTNKISTVTVESGELIDTFLYTNAGITHLQNAQCTMWATYQCDEGKPVEKQTPGDTPFAEVVQAAFAE